MTDFEFYKLADEQIYLLLNALRNSNNLNIKRNQNNIHNSTIELHYISLIESYLIKKELKFQSVKEYFSWIDKQVQIVNRKIKDDVINYHIGQKYLTTFVFLFKDLDKIYHGDELSYKIAMANIQFMIRNIDQEM